MEETYVQLIQRYNELVKRAGRDDFIIPIGEDTETTNELLEKLDILEKRIGMKLPDSYVEYLKMIGLYGIWFVPHHEMFAYNYADLLEFNTGASSYVEMKEYLLFGQDYGSHSWFFDVKNKLGKGKEAVYIVDRGSPMTKEYFEYKGKDFFEVIELFAHGNELDDGYAFPISPPTEDETIVRERQGKHMLQEIDKRLEKNPQEAEHVYADIKKIQEYIHSITVIHSKKMKDEGFAYIDEVEKEFKQELPLLYLVFMRDRRGGAYESENFYFSLIKGESLLEFNIGKWEKKFLKGYFLFADTGVYEIFMDIQNKQEKGVNAIYFIDRTEKTIDKARYLAKDLVDLFRILAENENVMSTKQREDG